MRGGNNFVDLTGCVFGRLAVQKRVANVGICLMYACDCSCGQSVTVTAASLRNGRTKSCGCLRRENAQSRATTHNGSAEPLHAVWNMMRQRCTNKRNKDYKYYGGRGIQVCLAWTEYSSFRDWAISSGYAQGLTIDRINTNGNYEPQNCRWITIQEQQKNRRSCKQKEENQHED